MLNFWNYLWALVQESKRDGNKYLLLKVGESDGVQYKCFKAWKFFFDLDPSCRCKMLFLFPPFLCRQKRAIQTTLTFSSIFSSPKYKWYILSSPGLVFQSLLAINIILHGSKLKSTVPWNQPKDGSISSVVFSPWPLECPWPAVGLVLLQDLWGLMCLYPQNWGLLHSAFQPSHSFTKLIRLKVHKGRNLLEFSLIHFFQKNLQGSSCLLLERGQNLKGLA